MKWLLGMVGSLLAVVAVALLGLGARDGRGRVTAAIEIDKPPSAVFPFLVQPELRRLWSLGLVEAKLMGSSTDLRAGTKSRVVIEEAERLEVEEEIRVLDADRRLLLQRTSSHPPFTQRLEYTLKEVTGRTLLTSAVHTSYSSLLLNIMEPVVTRVAQGRLEAELLALRTSAEAPPPAQPAGATLNVVSTPASTTPEIIPPPTTVTTEPPKPLEPPPPAPEETPTTEPPTDSKPAEPPPAPPPAPPAPIEPPTDTTADQGTP